MPKAQASKVDGILAQKNVEIEWLLNAILRIFLEKKKPNNSGKGQNTKTIKG